MTLIPAPEGEPKPLTTSDNSEISREIPFSIVWLNAVDPRIFTPVTWEKGGETTIRLRAADGSIRVNVYRSISRHLSNNEIVLYDEVYALKPGETEAGEHEVSQFKYMFDSEEQLTDFTPTPSLDEHMQGVIGELSGLVTIVGSTIKASNYATGQESNFVSDGTQWIEVHTGIAAPAPPPMNAGRLALNPPITE